MQAFTGNRTLAKFRVMIEESQTTEADLGQHRGRHLSYQRSRHVTNPKTSLIKIEGVDDTNAAK